MRARIQTIVLIVVPHIVLYQSNAWIFSGDRRQTCPWVGLDDALAAANGHKGHSQASSRAATSSRAQSSNHSKGLAPSPDQWELPFGLGKSGAASTVPAQNDSETESDDEP